MLRIPSYSDILMKLIYTKNCILILPKGPILNRETSLLFYMNDLEYNSNKYFKKVICIHTCHCDDPTQIHFISLSLLTTSSDFLFSHSSFG